MGKLGFVVPPFLRDPRWGQSQNLISPELLPQVDADVLLISPFGSTEQQLMAANPALANMNAVKAGRFYLLPDLSLSAPSVLSIPYGLGPLVPFLQRAVAQ